MRTLSITLLLCCACFAVSAEQQLPAYSRGYDPARDPFADGRAAIELAQRSGRRVLIEVGGDWCTWCHVLERLIRDHPRVRQALHEHYVLLKVNVSDANDNAEFMAGLPRRAGYPQLFVADADGDLVHAQDPLEFLDQGSYDPARVLAFLRRWAPPDGGV